MQQITDDLLDAVAGRAEFDLMESLAARLPIRAVCELLGVPPEGGDICRDAAAILGGFVPDDTAAASIIASIDAFDAFARDLIAARRAAPADDVITDMATAEVDGERLTDDELVAMCGYVLFAGHETTVQLICTLIRRYQDIELAVDPGELRWRDGFIRSLRTLPLRVTATAAG